MPAFSHIDQQFANGDTKPRLSVIGCENVPVIPVEQANSVNEQQKEQNNINPLNCMAQLNPNSEQVVNHYPILIRYTKNGEFKRKEGARMELSDNKKENIREKFLHKGRVTKKTLKIQLKPNGKWRSVSDTGKELKVRGWYDIAYEDKFGNEIVLNELRKNTALTI